MRLKIMIEMKRGGKMPLIVTGTASKNSYGVRGSPVWVEVEINSVEWLGGGQVADSNIKDMVQVQEAFLEELERQA